MTLLLRDDPEAIERYREHHQGCRRVVTARLRGIGIDHMQIFLTEPAPVPAFPQRTTTSTRRATSTSLTDDQEYLGWDELMRTFQERVPDPGWGSGGT